MSDATPVHADPEARISDAADQQPRDHTDALAKGVAGSATQTASTPTTTSPQPRPAQPSPNNDDDDDDDDELFIPRGPSAQTAVAGGKKGGRPR